MRWFSTFKACLLCDNRVFGMHCAKLFLHWRLLAKHLSFRCSGHSTVTHYEEIGKIVCLWLDFLCTRIMGEINYCYLLNIWLFGLTAWNWAWCQKKNVNINHYFKSKQYIHFHHPVYNVLNWTKIHNLLQNEQQVHCHFRKSHERKSNYYSWDQAGNQCAEIES